MFSASCVYTRIQCLCEWFSLSTLHCPLHFKVTFHFKGHLSAAVCSLSVYCGQSDSVTGHLWFGCLILLFNLTIRYLSVYSWVQLLPYYCVLLLIIFLNIFLCLPFYVSLYPFTDKNILSVLLVYLGIFFLICFLICFPLFSYLPMKHNWSKKASLQWKLNV